MAGGTGVGHPYGKHRGDRRGSTLTPLAPSWIVYDASVLSVVVTVRALWPIVRRLWEHYTTRHLPISILQRDDEDDEIEAEFEDAVECRVPPDVLSIPPDVRWKFAEWTDGTDDVWSLRMEPDLAPAPPRG